jgi:hypothetical protein
MAGFTLLEILLTTILFCFVGVMVYSIFSAGIRIEARSSRVFTILREGRLAMGLISREVENAFVYDFSVSDPNSVSLTGDPDRIRFLLPSDNGVQRVEYFLGIPNLGEHTPEVVGRCRPQLLVRRQTALADAFPAGKNTGEDEIIAAGLAAGSLHFEYGAFTGGESSAGGGASLLVWQRSWRAKELPAVVRVMFSFKGEDLPQGQDIPMSRDIVLPLGAQQERAAGLLVPPEILSTHTLDVRHLDSVKDFKQ